MVLRFLATLLSALVYAAAFPPHAYRWLAWGALVPFLLALRGTRPPGAAVLGVTWSIVAAYAVNEWFPRAVSGYFGQSAAVGIGLFAAVSTLTAGLQYAMFSIWYATLSPVARRPLIVAAGWVAADVARLVFLGGDPWAVLGYSQVGNVPLMQIAELGGVHALTFVVMTTNAALADVVRPSLPERRTASVVSAVGLVLAVFAYGAVRPYVLDVPSGPMLPVRVVQGNVDMGSHWRPDMYGRHLDRYLELSVAPDVPRGALWVWPESAFTFFLADEPAYREAIQQRLRAFDAELIAGGPHHTDSLSPSYFNSAFLLSSDGGILGRYDKQWLLPFAEYFPFRLDLLRRHFGRVREFSSGTSTEPLRTRHAPVGVLICNEAFFGDVARRRVADGAEVLVNLANDSWLGDRKFSEPAFDMVTLRAVEQRRWIIRASTAGPSALIDPLGHVVVRSPWAEAATLSGAVVPSSVVTPYAVIGDAFGIVCVLTAVVASVAVRGRESGV